MVSRVAAIVAPFLASQRIRAALIVMLGALWGNLFPAVALDAGAASAYIEPDPGPNGFRRVYGVPLGGTRENSVAPDSNDSNSLAARIPIILIHQYDRCGGIDPSPGDWDGFVQSFYANPGLQSTFKLYRMSWRSNEVPVSAIGLQLRGFLDALDEHSPSGFKDKPLILIGHSTGGLIARSYMQEAVSRLSPAFSRWGGLPGGERVLRLITLATPHHGTPAASGPFRDRYVDDYDRQAPAGANFSYLVDTAEDCGCAVTITQLAECILTPANYPLLPFDRPTRSDLRWDDRIPYFQEYEAASPGVDVNHFLRRLNCISPYDNPTNNPTCHDRDYSEKIIAHGGVISGLPRDQAGSFESAKACYDRHKPDIKAVSFCIVQTVLDQVFGMVGDGVVPLYSAWFSGARSEGVTEQRWPGYNHEQMVKGKTGAATDRLLLRLGEDIKEALPGPVARVTLSGGGKTVGDGGLLKLVVSEGGQVPVTFSSSGTSVDAGVPSYSWLLNGVVTETAPDFTRALGRGTYSVELRVVDSLDRSDTARGEIVVEEQGPPVRQPTVSTLAAAGVTSSSAILNAQVAANSTSAAVWFEWGPTATYGQFTLADVLVGSAASPYSRTVTGLSLNTTYHYRVVAVNNAGLAYGQDRTFTTTLGPDVTPPSISITSPTSAPTYVSSTSVVSLGGIASDDRVLTAVSWVSDQGGGGNANGLGSWTIPNIALAPGTNVITVKAWDGSGNSSSDVLSVTYNPQDAVSPTTTIVSGPSGTWSSASFTFTWAGADNTTPASSLVYTTYLNGFDSASTPYSADTSRTFNGIPNGSYAFTVRARDAAGNVDTIGATRTFTVNVPDTTAPSVSSLFLGGGGPNNDLFRTGHEYPIAFEATDNIRVTQADLYYSTTGGSPWNPIVTGLPVRAGQNVVDWTIPVGAVTANGALRVVVRDTAGNNAERTFGPLTIRDGTAPVVRVLAPDGSEDWPLGTTQTVRWTVSSTNSIVEIRLVGLGGANLFATVPGSATSYQWTIPPSGVTERGLIKITAVDVNGNEGEDFSDVFFRISNPDAPPPPPWHVPQRVTDLPNLAYQYLGHSVGQPAIVTDASGDLHVVGIYDESDRRDGFDGPLYTQQQIVYRKRQAGVWQPQAQITSYPTDVDSDGSDGSSQAHAIRYLRIAVDQNNRPHAIWVRSRENLPFPSFDDDLFYSSFDGSTWSAPLNLSAGVTSGGGSSTRSPALAVDSGGRVHALWIERVFPGTGRTIYHAIKAAGTWAAPSPITLGGYLRDDMPDLVADASGGLHLLSACDGCAGLHHNYFDGIGWTSQPIGEDRPDSVERIHLTRGPDGTLHAVWESLSSSSGPLDGAVHYTAFSGGSWTPFETVADPSMGTTFGPAVTVNSLGQPVVAWIDVSPVPPTGLPFVYVSERSETGWSSPTRISDRSTSVGSGTTLAMASGGGETHAAWAGTGGVIWNWANYSAVLSVKPGQLDFGTVYVGQSAEQAFLLENPTDTAVAVSIQTQPPFAAVGAASFSVPAGGQQIVTVRFSPTTSGNANQTAVFSSALGTVAKTATGMAVVDTTDPETVILAGPPATVTDGSAAFTWTGSDNATLSGRLVYAYRLDPLEPSFSPFGSGTGRNYSALGNGSYVFYVKARDEAGREDLTPASLAFTVNTPATLPVVTVTASVASANEAGVARGKLTFARTGATTATLVAKYSVGGSATAGTDYSALPGTVTFPIGAASVDVEIVPIDDAVDEPDETVVVTLTADPAYTLGSPSSATVTIVDNDLPGPDLLVTALTSPPAAARPGDGFSVTDTTRNQGSLTAAGSRTRYYLSIDSEKGPGDVLLSATRSVPSLNTQAESTGTVTVKIPTTMALGTYYMIACADDQAAVLETLETNNCRASVGQIQVTRPDLRVTQVGNPPSSAVPGASIVVSDTTRNASAVSAPASSRTRYLLSLDQTSSANDFALSGDRSVTALGPQAESSGSRSVTLPSVIPAGMYYLIACADATSAIVESDETNNCLGSAGRVNIGAPDLVVTSLSSPPATAARGSRFPVTDTTENRGTASSASSRTRYYLSVDTAKSPTDKLISINHAVAGLPAGGQSTRTTTVTIPSTTNPGLYYLLACADDLAAVVELDENNNCRASTTRVNVTP